MTANKQPVKKVMSFLLLLFVVFQSAIIKTESKSLLKSSFFLFFFLIKFITICELAHLLASFLLLNYPCCLLFTLFVLLFGFNFQKKTVIKRVHLIGFLKCDFIFLVVKGQYFYYDCVTIVHCIKS